MTIGLLDLSIVTDQLLEQLRLAKRNSRLWQEEPMALPPPIGTTTDPAAPAGDLEPRVEFDIVFTGLPPDTARSLGGACKVSLYLFHVAPDKFWRNTFPQARNPAASEAELRAEGRPRQVPEQPLALTLFYLLSAHSGSYVEEQQAMSIALKAFHDHAIVTATVPRGKPENLPRLQEFTVTMEPQTIDEVGRLWQSASSPLRLSAVYKASVIFLEPEPPKHDPAPPVKPKGFSVSAYPEFLISRAVVRPDGLVTVWGGDLSAPTLEVRVDGQLLTRIAETAPAPRLHPIVMPPPGPQPPQPALPALGTFRSFRDKHTLEFRLPSGTRPRIMRLGIASPADELEVVFTVRLEVAIP